jgi:hypothetical protein
MASIDFSMALPMAVLRPVIKLIMAAEYFRIGRGDWTISAKPEKATLPISVLAF